jgi:phage gpG-like protein
MVTGFISYEVDNDNQFKNALNKAIKSVGDLRFPMGEISRDIFKNTKKNFILKGDGKYPPLSPKYKAFKQKKRPSAPILVFDGDLRDSVTGTGNQDTIRNIGKQSLVQGTKVPYAKFVQEGTEFMPARKFLFIDDAQIIRLKRILPDYVTAKLEVVGNVV